MFDSLVRYLPALKKELSPDKPFGIGLRLSDLASRELSENSTLTAFRTWLQENDLYIFTMNGFPFGGFHNQVVKDEVHKPDWTTSARLDYSKRLAHILAALLPEGVDGGISTSPLSYKPWHSGTSEKEAVLGSATAHLIDLVNELLLIKEETGKLIHIDIEPEPDGFLENSGEVIRYFHDWLLPAGVEDLVLSRGLNEQQAKEAVLTHLKLCYDVCHFALAYEQPAEAFAKLTAAGIGIGKIQLSAALKAQVPADGTGRATLREMLAPFAESTYLHQVVARDAAGSLTHYPDLGLALDSLPGSDAIEWRTHFHIPLFTDSFKGLQSTQEDIVQVLAYLRSRQVTNHLEVETYTWEVLPEGLKVDLAQSIRRELEWVMKTINLDEDGKDGSLKRSGAHAVPDR